MESDPPRRPTSPRALRSLALIQAAATVLLVVWSGIANAGLFPVTVGEVSDRYRSPFTPASYAFSIWGLIYVALLLMGAFGVKRAFFDGKGPARRSSFVAELGWPFVCAQVACGAWLGAWLSDSILLSFVLMLALWACLGACVLRLDMERWDAPWSIIALVWWPMSLYSGWISVALLGNLSALLVALGWSLVETPAWAIVLAVVLAVFSVALVWLRNMREFSAVVVWALVAVAMRHSPAGALASVFWTALVAAVLVLASSAAHGLRRFTWPPGEARMSD